MAKPGLVLIGNWDWLLNNLVNPLIRAGIDLTVVAPPLTRLARAKGLNQFVEIPRFTEQAFIDYLAKQPQVLDGVSGTFIWSSDSIMRLAADSAIPEAVKDRILPTANRAGRKILGSKVGQVELFKDAGVNYPRTLILNSPSDWHQQIQWHTILAKGDQLGGGEYVREVSNTENIDLNSIPRDWYPVILQEKIQGALISVEAFYQNGNLIGWIYSETNVVISEFGPSISRTYRNPDTFDFVETLKILGDRTCLSGLVNTGFIYEIGSAIHHIFEFDARPNVWHHLWEQFDLPLAAAWTGAVETPVYPKLESPVNFYEPDRTFDRELAAGRILNSLRVLQGKHLGQLGAPTRSSFYERDRLVRKYIKVFFFPLLPIRARLISLIKALSAWLPISWLNRLRESLIARRAVQFLFDD